MLAIISGCALLYSAITATLIKSDIEMINERPELAPGGGLAGIVVRALAWPLFLAALIVMVPLWLIDGAISTWRGKP